MKTVFQRKSGRVALSLLLAAFLMGLSFAGSPSPVFVGNASELYDALSDAAGSGDATTICFDTGTSVIDTGSASLTIPSNVTLDLSTAGGTLRVSGGELNVYGTIAGGAVEVTSGTLVRQFGSSVTSTITVGAGGVVRGACVLSLENLDLTAGEAITSVVYDGESNADTSSFVSRLATGVIYVKLSGSNFSVYKTIETVMTDAGHIYRLGTKNTDTLSLVYSLTYGGLTGATLDALNPSGYTASDAAITLNNPAKDGFVFAGWTCDALGVTVPAETLVIPEGAAGDLTLIANWAVDPAGGISGKSGSGSYSAGASTTGEDAAAQQEAAAADTSAATTQGARRTRVASSSTKVTFTSDVDTMLPSLETLGNHTFPWGLALAGFAGLGVAIYITVKLVERKKQS